MLETVSVVLKAGASCPTRATSGSSGLDLYAHIESPIELYPMERTVVPTGVSVAIPVGFEGQVRPRSGLAAKKGVTVLNAPGTIDSDYTGEVGVILVNLSSTRVLIEPGERVAQLVFQQIEVPTLVEVDELPTTDRGDGGFGSTGHK